jgi:hypothetical protein
MRQTETASNTSLSEYKNGNRHLYTRPHWHQHLGQESSYQFNAPQPLALTLMESPAWDPYEHTKYADKAPTFHTFDKDGMITLPFENSPHPQVIGRYFASTLPELELVFWHIFEHGHYANWGVLQTCRNEAAKAIQTQLVVAMQHDTIGYSIIGDNPKTEERKLLGRSPATYPRPLSASSSAFRRPDIHSRRTTSNEDRSTKLEPKLVCLPITGR